MNVEDRRMARRVVSVFWKRTRVKYNVSII